MSAQYPLYLIPLLPLLGAAFTLLVGRRAGKNVVTLVACGAVGAAAIVALHAVFQLHHELPPGGALVDSFFSGEWIKAGDLSVAAGLVMDHLSAVLCLVVTGIGLLIHIYSTAYMEHDDRYTRFFAYLNLFTGAMLILVLGDSLPVTFVGWEGVGLCSYLLIGFWFDKEANAYAGRKAFVVNRIGDFGMLLAMFLIFSRTGTLQYAKLGGFLDQLHAPLWFGMPAAYFIGLLVLLGAAGKSAQIPLYVWLPDAMAGPTPVSALIHAATMVTAGVYVVARLHFVFELAPATLAAVAVIGALTALFAATIGIAQRDLKKVLAYSTISQLGFMFVGVGSYLGGTSTSNYQAGIFHLVTHAFFKAGLFLGAGSVMHALNNEGDITRMGGLRKWLPHTRWTFLIYCLAIAGIFPFAGFWSKDAILGGVMHAAWPTDAGAGGLELWFAHHLGHLLYAVLLLAAGCTAFYMFRLYFLVFSGEYRGELGQGGHGHDQGHGAHGHDAHGHGHDAHGHGHDAHGHGGLPHESPPAMTVVLWILAAGSILVGLLGIPDVVVHGADLFGEWLAPVLPPLAHEEHLGEFLSSAGVALAVSLAGIGLAWLLYGDGISARVRGLVAAIPRLYKLVFNKYYIDEVYDYLVVRPLRWTARVLWKAVDSFLIDTVLVTGVARLVDLFGRLARPIQNGDLQRYIVAIIIGAAAIFLFSTKEDVWTARRFQADVSGRDVTVTARGAGPTGHRLQYRVDWGQGWGTAQASPVFRHTFDSPGDKKITVEAIDPRWDTSSSDSHTVTVK